MITPNRLAGVLFLALALGEIRADPPPTLESAAIELTVDPASGAVEAMRQKRTGIAGTGLFFAPVFETNGRSARPGAVRLIRQKPDELHFSGSLAPLVLGLTWERWIRLDPGIPGFSIEDILRNDTGTELSFRVATVSRQQAEPWRRAERTLIASPEETEELRSPPPPKGARNLGLRGGPLTWRQSEESGSGFLYRTGSARRQGELTAQILPGEGFPLWVVWKSDPIVLAPGETLSARGTIELSP